MVPTYEQIREEIKRRFHVGVKTCWIADIKERHGLTRGAARKRLKRGRANPCPPRYLAIIEEVMQDLGMI